MGYKDDGLLRTVEDVIEMMESAERDVTGDFGPEGWEVGAHDVLTDQLMNCVTDEARDFLRRQL
jgi:hypothetical protein